MIEVLLDTPVAARLRKELRAAGSREIGGVLAGEDIGSGQFLVVDISVQRAGGGVAHFVRDPSFHRKFMQRFFARTNRQYGRFNYLGEWHSHPSFPALPSRTDLRQMQSLMEEKSQLARFLVLLIAKLDGAGALEAGAHAFRRQQLPTAVGVRAVSRPTVRVPAADSGMLSRARMAWRRESTEL